MGAGTGADRAEPSRIYKGGNKLRDYQVEGLYLSPTATPTPTPHPHPNQVEGLNWLVHSWRAGRCAMLAHEFGAGLPSPCPTTSS